MEVVPVTIELLRRIDAKVPLSEEMLQRAAASYAFCGVDGDFVFGAFGVTPIWSGYASSWAIISKGATAHHHLFMVRHVRDWLRQSDYRRVDTTVDADMGRTVQWLECMGFQVEGLLVKFDPEGRDHIMMAYTK